MIDPALAPPFSLDTTSQIIHASGNAPTATEGSGLGPGAEFAGFRLEQRLAHDEFGELWDAVDLVAEHGVTIRVFPRRFSHTPEKANRIKEYFRAVHAIHHQSILPIHRLGVDSVAGFYLVLHRYHGASLTDYCQSRVDKQRRLPIRDAIKLLASVARALDHVHERGVVHGDLRPQNILVDEKGNVQLISLGLSQLDEVTVAALQQNPDSMANSPRFLAPEQRRGERPGPKSDQYALGVVAYELLTGELPTLDGCTLFAMVNAGNLAGHVGDAFTNVLSSELAERFESCAAFIQALIGEETNTRRALGALGSNFLSELASKTKESSERKTAPADDTKQQLPKGEQERSADDAISNSDAANSRKNNSESISPHKARPAFAKIEPLRRMEAHRNGVTTVAYSHDGRFVLSGGKDKDVRVRDAKNARELRSLKGHSDRINGVAFCADGRQALSCSDDATIRIWETESGKQVRCLNGHRGGVKTIAIAPDRNCALSGGDDATLRLWNLDTGEELQQFGGMFSRHQGAINGLAFNRSGTLAVSGSLDGTVRLWNIASGRQTARLLKQKEGVNCVCFSADDRLVAAGTQTGKIHLWEVENGAETFCFDGHQRPVWSVACSPLGGRLLSAGWDGAICLWDLDRGTQLNRFTGHTSGVNSIAFSPDGRTALSGGFDGNLQFWSV